MPALVDTNLLIYRVDPRHPEKRDLACELLRLGVEGNAVRVPHQAVLEFVSVTTRPSRGEDPLLDRATALREAEDILSMFPILYPNEAVLRTALRGAAAYQLAWYDAHVWAYAEEYGLDELWSEDFQHGRVIGTVRIVNPFR